MVMKDLKEKHPYLFINIISLCVLIPLFLIVLLTTKGDLLFTDDIWHHINRFVGLYEAVKSGQFPVYIYPHLSNGVGCAAPTFYSDFFIFPFAMLQFLGIPHFICIYLYAFVCLLVSINVFYAFAIKILKNNNMSMLATLLFATNRYFVANVFKRFALGEFTATIFLLILGLGIYNLIKEDYSKPHLLLIAMLGLTLSHIISFALALIILLFVLIIKHKVIFSNKTFFKKTLTIIGLYVLLSAFFTLPFLEMMIADTYLVSSNPIALPSENALTINWFFSFYHVTPIFSLILLCLFLIPPKHEDKLLLREQEKTHKSITIVILILCVLMTDLAPWKYLEKVFGFIQFPWRLNVFIAPLISIVAAYLLTTRVSIPKFRTIFICVLCMLSTISIAAVILQKPHNTQTVIEHSWFGSEWYPSNTNYHNFKSSVVDDNNNEIDFKRNGYELNVEFDTNASDYYIVPLVYYKGYEAEIKTTSGVTQLRVEKDQYGIKVHTKGMTGTVTVSYNGTWIQKFAPIVSLVSTIGIITFISIKTLKRKKRS